MKLIVSKDALAVAIKAVLPGVATRAGLPALSGIRIAATRIGLSVETTDLDLAVSHSLTDGVTVSEHGSVIVPAKTLAKVVDAMPGDDVRLESSKERDRGGLKVESRPRSVSLDGWRTEDWPGSRDAAQVPKVATVDAAALADAFGRTALCASKDEVRPVLTSVALCIAKDEGTLEVVATDSYRLGVVRVPLSAPAKPLEVPALVPARVAKALARQLKGVRGTVDVRFLGPKEEKEPWRPVVAFTFGSSSWTSRAVDGDFPSWRQVMPDADGARLDFDPAELRSALKAAASVRKGKGGPSPIRLSLDRTCSLAVSEPELGTMRENLPEATFSPNGVGAVEVSFNPDYLADAIRVCGTAQGRMWIRDALKAVLFEGRERSYALMPVRTR